LLRAVATRTTTGTSRPTRPQLLLLLLELLLLLLLELTLLPLYYGRLQPAEAACEADNRNMQRGW
jgi:hypothetical protein